MMTPLLPQAFWFRLAVPCRRIDGLPRTGAREASARPPRVVPPARRPRRSTGWRPGPMSGSPGTPGAWPSPSRRPRDRAAPRARRPARGAGRLPGLGRHPRHPQHQPRDPVLPPLHGLSARVWAARVARRRRASRSRSPARSPTPRSAGPSCSRRVPSGSAGAGGSSCSCPPRHCNGFDPETNRRLGFAYQVSDRPRPRGPVPRRRPRVPRRREPEPLVDPGTARSGLRRVLL